MSERMSNAPVYYALAQVQFNPVAAMAKYVDEIQDSLRREKYTLFEPLQVTHLQLANPPNQSLPEPQVAQALSWLITKADRTSGFILAASSVSFHTTHYETRNEFIPEILKGLEIIHRVVGLDHISRLGLRYLDAIIPRLGESVDQYLADGLHGIEFGAKQRYSLNESVFETSSGPLISNGTLVARVHRMTSALGYPPDMVPNGLLPMPRFDVKDERDHAVIDTDHFVEGQMIIDYEMIKTQLYNLHLTVKDVFRATTTKYAHSIWSCL